MSEIVKTISENATVVLDRFQYKAENEGLYARHGELEARYGEVLEELKQSKADVIAGEEFLRYFKEMTDPITSFNDFYWDKLLDQMIMDKGKKLTAVFIGGYSVKVRGEEDAAGRASGKKS